MELFKYINREGIRRDEKTDSYAKKSEKEKSTEEKVYKKEHPKALFDTQKTEKKSN